VCECVRARVFSWKKEMFLLEKTRLFRRERILWGWVNVGESGGRDLRWIMKERERMVDIFIASIGLVATASSYRELWRSHAPLYT